jgi:NitT/TauT family transport system substrate-binding protein
MRLRLAVVALALMTGGLAGCQAAATAPGAAPADSAPAPASPPARQHVTVAITSPNEMFAIPWVAQDSGLFARHGLDAEVMVVGGSPRVTQSLVAGDFDYAIAAAAALIRARAQGADPRIIAGTSDLAIGQKIMVAPGAAVRSLADLRGKTVGITQYGSEAHTFIQLALARAGLDPSEVTILQLGASPQVAAAVASGHIDAGVVSGPAGLRAERAGGKVLVDARDLGILSPQGTLATTQRLIERDRDQVLRFLTAYVEAIHFFKTNPAETKHILQQRMGDLPVDEVAYLYDGIKDVYRPLPTVSAEAIQAVIDREEDIPRTITPGDVLDMSLLQEIEQRGLLRQLYP